MVCLVRKTKICTWQYAIPTSCFPDHADATRGGRSAPMTTRLPSTTLIKYGVRSYCWNEGLVRINSDRSWRAQPKTTVTATLEARTGYTGIASVWKYIGTICCKDWLTFCCFLWKNLTRTTWSWRKMHVNVLPCCCLFVLFFYWGGHPFVGDVIDSLLGMFTISDCYLLV